MLGWRQPDELSPTLADLMTKTVNEEPIVPGEGILHHASGVDLVPANIELLEDVPLVSQQVQQAEEERQEDMKKEVRKHEYQR